jgi:hypothetical protein
MNMKSCARIVIGKNGTKIAHVEKVTIAATGLPVIL